MYVRATSMRFSRGRSTPTRRAMCSSPTCLEGLIRHLAAPGSPQARRSLRPAGGRLAPVASSLHLRSEEHTPELQSRGHLVCRLLLEKTEHMPTPTLDTIAAHH